MTATTDSAADPIELVRRLDPDALTDRIAQLDRERDALMVLLRAALRARTSSPTASQPTGGQS